ncbi:hypothetical protein, partial [Streptomyces sp. NRRL WC-3725]|uniref:hypothetical protein n=1 Tax=Streptomyces sp. NRRL WC-3725 TaxID=1463933 RepID=UPI0005BA0F47
MNAPGADELRMRYLLRRRGVGPDARPDTPDETSERKPDTAAPAEPSHVRGGGRLPDWRRGEHRRERLHAEGDLDALTTVGGGVAP